MSGQLKAAPFKQKNRQRSTQMAETSLNGGHQKWNQSSMTFCTLDDPVLEGIKRHLTIASRIGFEPISRRFARIAFFIRNRMEMKLIDFQHKPHYPKKISLKLMLKRKNGDNECPFDINDVENAFHSLFRRVQKWRSVDFGPYWMQHLITDQLLNAMLDESLPTIVIRRFSCRLVNERLQEKVAELLHRCAPMLRSLYLGVREGDDLLSVLVQAIGSCRELRRLAVGSSLAAGRFPPSFLPMLHGLEKLDGLFIGYWWAGRLMAARHSLSITGDWLPFVARPAFCPLLKKMDRLNVEERWNRLLPVADLASILSEIRMRSTVRVIIRHGDIDWTAIWDDILPMVQSTRSNLLITGRGLLGVTAEAFAAGLSSLPAILQTSLISPDIQNSPLDRYNRYMKLTFRISSGGRLTVCAY